NRSPRSNRKELMSEHLATRITARDRAREFPVELYEDGGVLFCKVCQHSNDYIRGQTAVAHLRTLQNNNRSNTDILTSERKEFTLDFTRTLIKADIPVEKGPKFSTFLKKHCKQGGSTPAPYYQRSDYLPELYSQYEGDAVEGKDI
uniref:Uncharacterized protein n=1 Tax=Oncorhynchus tshawytscha TaxID=74940 RepID=A0A8C8GX22_ONCTS